jgi:hypothetical protein
MTLRCPETSGSYYPLTQRHIPQERNPHATRSQELKKYPPVFCMKLFFSPYPADVYWIDFLPGSGYREGDFLWWGFPSCVGIMLR